VNAVYIISIMLTGALIFFAGYMTCFYFACTKKPHEPKRLTVKVPRVKPSLRNPMRTYNVEYERYKARDSNLYQPSKPKR